MEHVTCRFNVSVCSQSLIVMDSRIGLFLLFFSVIFLSAMDYSPSPFCVWREGFDLVKCLGERGSWR